MQTMTGGFFLPRDYNFYDSCVMAVLGATIFELYDVIRRHVWRSTTKGEVEVRRMVSEGLIVARISQQSIGAHIGLKRDMVNRHVRRMRELGWLKVVEVTRGDLPVYVLGERVTDAVGKQHEVFYADAWMNDLWAALVTGARAILGVGNSPTAEQDSAHENHSALTDGHSYEETSWVKAIPETERARLVAEHLHQQGCDDTEQDPCGAESVGGTEPSPQGGTDCSPQGGTDSNPHKSREGSEVEKQEVENLLAVAALRQGGDPDPESSEAPLADPKKRIPPVRQARSTADMEAIIAEARDHSADYVERAKDKMKSEARARGEKHLQDENRRAQKKANLQGKTYSLEDRRLINALYETWAQAMKERWPSLQVGKWTPKDVDLVKKLVDSYSGDLVRQALSYLVEQWDAINGRIFKNNKASYPSVTLLYSIHATIFAESQRFAEMASIYREYKKCYRDNPNDLPPEELRERYRKIKPELEALGITLK